jgi:hypothetical protein
MVLLTSVRLIAEYHYSFMGATDPAEMQPDETKTWRAGPVR